MKKLLTVILFSLSMSALGADKPVEPPKPLPPTEDADTLKKNATEPKHQKKETKAPEGKKKVEL